MTAAASVRPAASSSAIRLVAEARRVKVDPRECDGHFGALPEAVHADVGQFRDFAGHSGSWNAGWDRGLLVFTRREACGASEVLRGVRASIAPRQFA